MSCQPSLSTLVGRYDKRNTSSFESVNEWTEACHELDYAELYSGLHPPYKASTVRVDRCMLQPT